ncbi:hypothetical protein Vc3S01_A0957 [Vibrio campbellii]|nr:hypothetical protein Vc3S01_A0957 [Vibrio campbellii]
MEGWHREPLAFELNQNSETPNSYELTNGIKNLAQQTDPKLFENF